MERGAKQLKRVLSEKERHIEKRQIVRERKTHREETDCKRKKDKYSRGVRKESQTERLRERQTKREEGKERQIVREKDRKI